MKRKVKAELTELTERYEDLRRQLMQEKAARQWETLHPGHSYEAEHMCSTSPLSDEPTAGEMFAKAVLEAIRERAAVKVRPTDHASTFHALVLRRAGVDMQTAARLGFPPDRHWPTRTTLVSASDNPARGLGSDHWVTGIGRW